MRHIEGRLGFALLVGGVVLFGHNLAVMLVL
jgi:hypothetical protein